MFLDCSPVVLSVPVKVCNTCGEVKPATSEYFRTKNGAVYGYCRECHRKSANKWRKENPERAQSTNRAYRESRREDKADYDRQYRAKNREKIAETGRIWYEKNRDLKREYDRRYRDENREAISARRHKRYIQTREARIEYNRQYRARTREARIEYSRKWNKANADRVKVYHHIRRAREYQSTGTCTAADLAAIRAAQTDKKGRLICWQCGKPITDAPHLDHWIPLSKGGTNDPGNLRYMHARCNLRKHDKLPHEMGRLI